MPYTIFCPDEHLMLGSPRCPVCGWTRPAPTDLGKPLWQPLELGSGLGGPGSGVPAYPAASSGSAVLPLRSGELMSIEILTGYIRWRDALPAGQRTRWLVPDGERILAVLGDEKEMLASSNRSILVSIDPASRQRTLLWEGEGHQVTPPALAGERILLRTVASELLCLHRNEPSRILWRQPLENWWMLPPVIAGDWAVVCDGRAFHKEGLFKAFALQDGAPGWSQPVSEFINDPPCIFGGLFVYREGHSRLVAHRTADGSLAWSREFERVYSPPGDDGERLFVTVRGAAGSGEHGHYLLLCLDPQSGETLWQAPLPERVRLKPLVCGSTVVLGDDEGWLRAIDMETQEERWGYHLGNDEENHDPVRALLLPEPGVLLAGSYSGRLTVLSCASPAATPANAEELLAKEEFEQAAAAYALAGEYLRAAKVFQEKLNKPLRALLLLEHGHYYKEAADLAKEIGDLNRAEENYRRAGELLSQADVLLQKGDTLGAAAVYAAAGELETAAELYLSAGERSKALELYRQMGNFWEYVRQGLYDLLKPDEMKQLYERKGPLEAAQAAQQAGHWQLALEWLNEAVEKEMDGARQAEFEALQTYTGQHPEVHWRKRLAESARRLGKFRVEAETWDGMGDALKAADAYWRSAMQMEHTQPRAEEEIASLYEKAEQQFTEAGDFSRIETCHQKVLSYRHLPCIDVSGKSEKSFRENEWSTFELLVKNIGYGQARDIRFRIGEDRFDMDDTNAKQGFNLASGKEEEMNVFLRPRKETVGEEVPLVLEWSWRDRYDREYSERKSQAVAVKAAHDSKSGTPVVIHADTYVEGTYFKEGHNVQNGGQVGDKVEIHRGEGRGKVKLDEAELEKDILGKVRSRGKFAVCPVCKLPVEPGDNHCTACGAPLEGQ